MKLNLPSFFVLTVALATAQAAPVPAGNKASAAQSNSDQSTTPVFGNPSSQDAEIETWDRSKIRLGNIDQGKVEFTSDKNKLWTDSKRKKWAETLLCSIGEQKEEGISNVHSEYAVHESGRTFPNGLSCSHLSPFPIQKRSK